VGETLGVGDGGGVGVEGGTGVAVGTTGVDSSEPGEGISTGASVGAGLDTAETVPVASSGVPLCSAIPGDIRSLVKTEKAAKAPTHITANTKKNAKAEPLLCTEVIDSSRAPGDSQARFSDHRVSDIIPREIQNGKLFGRRVQSNDDVTDGGRSFK
jgi:hypothetical protein